MANYDALLQPLTIKSLTLRNRVMSSSHGPGYVTGGVPTDRFIRYHAEKAEGGIGLTILGSSSVALDSPSGPYGIISVREDAAVPHLRRVADAVHAHCGAVMIQLVQMGRRMHWDGENWLPLLAPSSVRERLHRAFPKVMEDHDYPRVVRNFADAARRCEEAGIDGIELSCAHLQLIDQHWSPLVNKRTDGYGGGFEGRMRFGVEVMEAMRAAVSADYVIGIRMSADELIAGGNGLEECLAIARYHAERGLVDFIDVIGGQSTTHHHRTYAIPSIDLPSAPFLALASAIRQAVDVPVFHAQKIADIETAARAVEGGPCRPRGHDPGAHRRPPISCARCRRAGKGTSAPASAPTTAPISWAQGATPSACTTWRRAARPPSPTRSPRPPGPCAWSSWAAGRAGSRRRGWRPSAATT